MELKNFYYSAVFLVLAGASDSEAGPGTGQSSSSVYSNTEVFSGTTVEEYSETVYFGSGTTTINGTLEIWGKNIWVHPDAVISGTGVIKIMNPGNNPFWEDMTSGPTTIDGNNNANFIDVNVSIQNPSNLVLNDIDDPGYGSVNPSGSLAASLNLGNNIDFAIDHGNIVVNAYYLTLDADASLTNYGIKRCVVTNDNSGELIKKAMIQDVPFFFPMSRTVALGDNDYEYTPANITVVSGGPTDYHMNVRAFDETNVSVSELESGGNVQRVWMLYAGSPGSTAKMEYVNLNGIEDNGYDHNYASVVRYNGTNWISDISPSAEVYGPFGLPAGYQSQYEIYSVPTAIGPDAYYSKSSDPVVLPVTLTSFWTRLENTTVMLNWATSSELNSSYFDIQRSADAKNWIEIGRINATGESNVIKTYGFSDSSPNLGLNYYRLKMVDLDNSFAYSTIRSIKSGDSPAFVLYPNPVADQVTISGTEIKEIKQIQVFSLTGEQVFFKVNPSENYLNLSGLFDGIYFMKTTKDTGEIITRKLVISKR